MKKILAIIGITLCTSLGAMAESSVTASVNELRAQVNQVAVEVAEGDEAGAVAAAEQAYQTWLSLPPAVRRAIERANPGTEQKLADLDEEAVAQIEGESESESSSGTTVNYTPRPAARYHVAKEVQDNQSGNTQTASNVTTVETASGTAVAGGRARVTTSQSGSTTSASTTAAGGAYNPNTGRWIAGAHRGDASATQNADGSYDTSHSGQTAVASSEGGATVSHSGSGDDLGSGSGSYNSATSVQTASGQSYQNSNSYQNDTDIFGSTGLGQGSSKSYSSGAKKSSPQKASSSRTTATPSSGSRSGGRKCR